MNTWIDVVLALLFGAAGGMLVRVLLPRRKDKPYMSERWRRETERDLGKK